MMSFPKISIITPSFNQGKYIEQTILSIINQGYPNLEYIIIDGGSTDETLEIIKKYESDITYWVSEPDKGQSDALNKGLAKCTGEIFNWINSDDYLEENSLFTVASVFTENPGISVVCGYNRMFNDVDNSTILMHRCGIFEATEKSMVLQKNDQQASFYKLSAIRALGGINTSLHYVMDLELWFRYLSANGQDGFKIIDNLLAHFRIHANSKTGLYEERFRIEESALWYFIAAELKLNKNFLAWFKDKKSYNTTTWDFKCVSKNLLESELLQYNFYNFYRAGNKKLGRKALIEIIKKGKARFNYHFLALFVKLFIGNISLKIKRSKHRA